MFNIIELNKLNKFLIQQLNDKKFQQLSINKNTNKNPCGF